MIDLAMIPAWALVALVGAVVGFLGGGILGAALLGGVANITLNWNSLLIPPSGNWWDFLFGAFGWVSAIFPTFDIGGAVFLMVSGAVIGAIGAYVGAYLGFGRSKGGKTL